MTYESEKQILTSEGTIFMCIQRISVLSSQLYFSASPEWQQAVMNYYYAVLNFQAILHPHLSDDDKQRIRGLIEHQNDLYFKMRRPVTGNRMRHGSQVYINMTIDLANSIFTVLVERLSELGMYMEGSVDAEAGPLDDYQRYDGSEQTIVLEPYQPDDDPLPPPGEAPDDDDDEDTSPGIEHDDEPDPFGDLMPDDTDAEADDDMIVMPKEWR